MKNKLVVVFIALSIATLSTEAQTVSKSWKFKAASVQTSVEMRSAQFHDSYFDVNSKAATPPSPTVGDNQNANQDQLSTLGYTSTIIGTTYFDLQTNASICNDLFRDNDGTLYAVWNFAPANDPLYLMRGTGFNQSDGTNWEASPAARIESSQNGWPNVTRPNAQNVIVLTHNLDYAQLQLSRLVNPVTKTWTETRNVFPTTALGGVWWPRMVRGGSDNASLHVLALTLPLSRAGELYQGQDGALLYSRSQDGGASWDIVNESLADIGSSEYYRIRPDNYAIDANGSTVAIVVGGFGNDLMLLKSTDNGNTWSHHLVMQFPIPRFNDQFTDINHDGIMDTLDSNDGSLAVLVDNNGIAHVWGGYVRVYNRDTTDHTMSYVPTSNGIYYYDETMGDTPPRIIAGALDLDGNGVLNVSNFGTFNSGLASQPSAAIDADGNIYLTYAAVVENDPDADGKDVRHTYLMSSRDNGASWSYPSDVVVPFNNEGIFGCLARSAGSKIQLIYQRDVCAGVSTTYGFPDPCNTGKENKIIYTEIPAEQVLAVHDPEMESEVKIYPNPVSDILNITLPVSPFQKGNVAIYDLEGKQLMNWDALLHNDNSFDLKGLSNGMYLLHITSDQLDITRKFSIGK